jgi:energy-coupling factor transporter ATP-binding protein EcfA2
MKSNRCPDCQSPENERAVLDPHPKSRIEHLRIPAIIVGASPVGKTVTTATTRTLVSRESNGRYVIDGHKVSSDTNRAVLYVLFYGRFCTAQMTLNHTICLAVASAMYSTVP